MSTVSIKVHITIEMTGHPEHASEEILQIANNVIKSESIAVRKVFESELADHFGAGALGDQAH